ncbi:unnamed protein product [Lota lota]
MEVFGLLNISVKKVSAGFSLSAQQIPSSMVDAVQNISVKSKGRRSQTDQSLENEACWRICGEGPLGALEDFIKVWRPLSNCTEQTSSQLSTPTHPLHPSSPLISGLREPRGRGPGLR